jgi:hypothetical protein
MSDLLKRMIHRASGGNSPVEPLLASRYEPQMSPMAELAPAPAAVERAPVRQIERPGEQPTAEVTATKVREDEWRPDVSEQPVPARMEEASVTHVPSTGRLVPPPVSRQDANALRERLPIPDAANGGHAQSAGPTEHTLQVPARTILSETETRAAERTRPLMTTEEARVELTTIRPKAPTPAADIEITIGHVELRMSAPAPPQPKPQLQSRPAQPRLSLDDYLRRRNGGAR